MAYPAAADFIIQRITDGESVRKICADEGMPSQSMFYRWLADPENADLREKYARAKEAQMERFADEIIEISDDTSKDTHVTVYEDGNERTSPNTEWISRSRLRVDSRKWLMSKLAPKKYGDKLEAEVKGGITVTIVDDWARSRTDPAG